MPVILNKASLAYPCEGGFVITDWSLAATAAAASTFAAVIAAVDNGDNASHEPFHATVRRAFQGRCFALIQAKSNGVKTNEATNHITVEASAPGLTPASISIQLHAD